jgi:hypothetical protein
MSLIWTNAALEPKRKFKYLLSFTGLPDFQFLAQTCDRPGVKVGASEHKYFDKTYYHPGKVTWDPNPLSVKLVDIQKIGADTSVVDTNDGLMDLFVRSGLSGLIAVGGEVRTIGKFSAVNALGTVNIRVLNSALNSENIALNTSDNVAITSNGVTEQWILQNAWLESFKPDALDYASEDILTVTMQIRYDWAELKTGAAVDDNTPIVNKFG